MRMKKRVPKRKSKAKRHLAETPESYRAEPPSFRSLRKPRPKRAANVLIDAEILAVAKEMKINLSQTLENELRKLTQEAREQKWQEDNREFIDSCNRLIERAGVAGEEFQDWDEPEA
jgi:antitoxin CcdA